MVQIWGTIALSHRKFLLRHVSSTFPQFLSLTEIFSHLLNIYLAISVFELSWIVVSQWTLQKVGVHQLVRFCFLSRWESDPFLLLGIWSLWRLSFQELLDLLFASCHSWTEWLPLSILKYVPPLDQLLRNEPFRPAGLILSLWMTKHISWWFEYKVVPTPASPSTLEQLIFQEAFLVPSPRVISQNLQ